MRSREENRMTSPLPGPAAPLPPPPVAYTPVPVGPQLPKNPWAALVLSLFPGVGQIYNGQPAKGLVFFFSWVGCIYGTAEIDPFPLAFLIPFVYFFNLIDAWRGATAINNRFLGGQPLPEEDAAESPLWGAGLVALGLLLLVNNLGWLDLHALRRWWPLMMVLLGGAFLYNAVRRRQGSPASPLSAEDDLRVR
jgi:TM2 domain-containing membrane protein YozV